MDDQGLNEAAIFLMSLGEEEAAERLIPFDIVPRILSGTEWRRLTQGIEQRVQALNAFMSGVAYLAIRIRTRSIIPILIIHAAWDFAVFMIGSGAQAAPADPSGWQEQLVGGLMLVGPLFVYGLWLVRNQRVRAGWRDDSLGSPHFTAGETP